MSDPEEVCSAEFSIEDELYSSGEAILLIDLGGFTLLVPKEEFQDIFTLSRFGGSTVDNCARFNLDFQWSNSKLASNEDSYCEIYTLQSAKGSLRCGQKFGNLTLKAIYFLLQ